MSNKEGRGFLTFAFNTGDVDYLRLAYLQALNIKATQNGAKYAVVTDQDVEHVPLQYRRAFDYIIPLQSFKRAWDAEPYAHDVSPFKETIKLEADLLFTRSIEHWWTAFRLRDVCMSYQAKTFNGVEGSIRKYREMFDANNLPDVYNGLMYFRYSQGAHDFFLAAQFISRDWDRIKTALRNCDEERPSTDVMYGIAALIVGQETVTIPSMDFVNFVHMKPGFQGWSDERSWLDTVISERDGDIIRINNLNQYNPVHYYDKTYATDELIEYYEQRVLGRS